MEEPVLQLRQKQIVCDSSGAVVHVGRILILFLKALMKPVVQYSFQSLVIPYLSKKLS